MDNSSNGAVIDTVTSILARIEAHRLELGLAKGTPSSGAFVRTVGNCGQRHPSGIVGAVFIVRSDGQTMSSPPSRLRAGEVYVGLAHSGDCFQDYGKLVLVEGRVGLFRGKRVCGYGLPGSEKVLDLPLTQLAMLRDGLLL